MKLGQIIILCWQILIKWTEFNFDIEILPDDFLYTLFNRGCRSSVLTFTQKKCWFTSGDERTELESSCHTGRRSFMNGFPLIPGFSPLSRRGIGWLEPECVSDLGRPIWTIPWWDCLDFTTDSEWRRSKSGSRTAVIWLEWFWPILRDESDLRCKIVREDVKHT